MKKNRDTRLYNVIFPIWMLWLFPQAWLFILPANFLIDLLVLAVTMKCMKISPLGKTLKSVILRVWLFGFLADFIGTGLMMLSVLISPDNATAVGSWWNSNIAGAVPMNPFANPFAFLFVTFCVAASAWFLYLFNFRHCYAGTGFTDAQKRTLALSMALVTAPWLFYLPTAWIYS